jgi:hypothetical protein
VSVRDTLEHLRTLQAVDLGIKGLEDDLALLPKNLEAARDDQRAVDVQLKAAEASLQDVVKRRRTLEGEIKDAEQKVARFETQKLSVKTNEEYTALNHQIAHEKQRRSELEDQVLASFDEEATVQGRIARWKDDLKRVAEAVKLRERELAERSEADRARLVELRAERENAVATLESKLLSRYEAIRSRNKGVAVVNVMRGACGGCFTQQPPQKVNEVRKEEALHTCEGCGRILVWDNAEATAS